MRNYRATLQKKIIEFLTSLPNMDDANRQRAFIYGAGLDRQLHDQIVFGKSRKDFVTLLVSVLTDYGWLRDGRNALEAVLDAARESVGQDKNAEYESLIQALRAIPEGTSDTLQRYFSLLTRELHVWRVPGLPRDVRLEEVYVHTTLRRYGGGQDEAIAESVLLQELLTPPKSESEQGLHLLIEGDAGSGKSTLLRHWALTLVERVKDAQHGHIPAFLSLRNVALSCRYPGESPPSIPDLIADRFAPFGDHRAQSLKHVIADAMKSGHALILLDGFDEIPEAAQPAIKTWIGAVRRAAGQNPIVLTARPWAHATSLSGFDNYTLCSFDRDQQARFMREWFQEFKFTKQSLENLRKEGIPDKIVENLKPSENQSFTNKEEFLDAVKRHIGNEQTIRYKELILKHTQESKQAELMQAYLKRPNMYLISDHVTMGNPLFLTMVCIEFELTGHISRTPAMLVEQFTKILLRDLRLLKGIAPTWSLDVKRRFLELAASRFFEDNRLTFPFESLLECGREAIAESGVTAESEAVLREIEQMSGLLVEDRHGDWQFSHLLFHEFFVARFRWRRRQNGKSNREWLQMANFTDRYERVMKFYSQL